MSKSNQQEVKPGVVINFAGLLIGVLEGQRTGPETLNTLTHTVLCRYHMNDVRCFI